MTPLITKADIALIESISLNIDSDKKVRPAILDAQEFDIRPLIGEEFWIDIVDSAPTFTGYEDLMNEFTYTYKGRKYQHPGLKAVIIMYAYSRYKMNANEHDTAFGVVVKRNDYSDPVSDRQISRQIANAKSGAEVYWLRVRDYLDRHKEDYPLWSNGCSRSRLTGTGVKIRSISRKSNPTRRCRYNPRT